MPGVCVLQLTISPLVAHCTFATCRKMLQRTPSLERYSDYLFSQLDDLTSRARVLRSEALRVETEKAAIIRLAHKLSHSSELQHCAEVDREDVIAAVEHTRAVLESSECTRLT